MWLNPIELTRKEEEMGKKPVQSMKGSQLRGIRVKGSIVAARRSQLDWRWTSPPS